MCDYLHRIQKIAITPFYSLRLKECNLKWKCQQRFWVQLFQISARQCFLDKYLRKRMIFFQLWLFCRLIVLRRYSGPPAGEPETPEHALIWSEKNQAGRLINRNKSSVEHFTVYQKRYHHLLIICNHIQISTQPDSTAIVIVKEVVMIVIMTTLCTILPQHIEVRNQQVWSKIIWSASRYCLPGSQEKKKRSWGFSITTLAIFSKVSPSEASMHD